jgi:signal transduction histidine kinase
MGERPASALIYNRQVERLLEVSRTLSSTLDLPRLLQSVVDGACELTGSEAASILLFDPQTNQLRFEASPGAQRQGLRKLGVPLEGSIAGWVYTHRQPLIVQDVDNDKRFYRGVDTALGFQTHSILGVPLLVKQQPLGVIEAVNKRQRGHYTEDDRAILEMLSAQAAIAIENARLMSRLQDANSELMRLDRMKSDFIAIASHELRTPLGLILGHATFLKDSVAADQQEQMDVIIRSAMRLKAIIEDLSTIAQKDGGQSRVRKARFSLSKLVAETVGRFSEVAKEKKIELGYDIPENDALEVDGDRDKIDVALANLVRNAITFTDPGGQVGIKAEGIPGYARVFVVDTGIGIPKDSVERVFERFYQVESHLTRRHGGMGLGLSIAKAMVEMHHGQIWCESKEGTGSLFCFVLPVNEKQSEAASKVFTNA